MSTNDIVLYDTASGGDFAIENDDLQMGESFYQQVYLALFGGNVEASTKPSYLDGEERFDYWANSLLFKDVPSRQFNSKTERLLKQIALNSSGRASIIQAVESDLEYLKQAFSFTVDVKILSVNRAQIAVNIQGKSGQEDSILQFIYDNIKNEVITQTTI